MINVLSVTSECAPLVKTGGLADVAGALPGALRSEGVDMRTLLPGYPAVLKALGKAKVELEIADLFGGAARVLFGQATGLDLYVIDAPHLFDRPGNIYLGPDGKDWPDNPQRFAALSWVAAKIGAEGIGGWSPAIIHGHDWQAGFVPEYLRLLNADPNLRTVLTIHNIAFHGIAPPEAIKTLGLDPKRFDQGGYEFWGRVSALKAGLMGSDRLTTVSQTYAEELMTDSFGMGFDGVMRFRRNELLGILNGIDLGVWDPATDPNIKPFKTPSGKAANKKALREEFGLPDAEGPLCVVVSRLTEQKGLDLLLNAIPTLTAKGGQLIVLGAGDAVLEASFRAATSNPNVAVHIGYDEALSHRLIAGGDAILVPSRFEPCGLTQLYGLRYGTIPVVALTGGLADTVINASPAALSKGVATGLQFAPITTESLRNALSKLCTLYSDKPVWQKMQKNAMAQAVGWETSAKAYAALYEELAGRS
ncbi:glycogen synthase GlgA [Marivivens sp. LCG002]|uniref:glycogen synthase GlgA n=1 Tax=Marivivens sp. LCG002 TaxID=3051171 RepID=UPI0025574448|nr:glycogen synthase GlgA [Marivivens sp. LCG002]WIV49669.1 glycogen synthase GlgA [Marivivens sp. LCG002]